MVGKIRSKNAIDRRRKNLEKILDYDHRLSIKWWKANLATVTEGLRTGIQVDGSTMTEEDRAVNERIKGFILDNIHMIESLIDGLEEFGEIAIESIGGWISGVDDDTVTRDFIVKADEFIKLKNMEKLTREKWI